jgi:hypothetical protein
VSRQPLHLVAEKDWKRDGGGEPPYDGGMESRVAKLEDVVSDVRERLVRIETRLDHAATKEELQGLRADMHRMEATLIKWFVATAAVLATLAFSAAKFVH